MTQINFSWKLFEFHLKFLIIYQKKVMTEEEDIHYDLGEIKFMDPPEGLKAQEIFHVEKSENRNRVYYEVLYSEANPEVPVDLRVYWIEGEHNNKIVGINWIEKKLSYGICDLKKTENKITFKMASMKHLLIEVFYKDGKFVAVTTLNGTPSILKLVYVSVTTIILIKPVIHYVRASGSVLETGEPINEKFLP